VLVAASTPAALAAKQATSIIPIVMLAVGEPVQVKLIDSLAHPGGNVTGLSLIALNWPPNGWISSTGSPQALAGDRAVELGESGHESQISRNAGRGAVPRRGPSVCYGAEP